MTDQNYTYNKAYTIIRDKILNGDFTSDEKLTEMMLAKKLNMSRTPIRHAITKLEQEGLIKNKKIHIPNEKEIRDIYEVRILLESYAIKYCATYISEESIHELENCVTIGRNGTPEEQLTANYHFHQIICLETNNMQLIDIINRMQSIIYILRNIVTIQKRPHLIDEHEEILLAIKNGDGEKAAILNTEHLRKDLEFSIQRIDKRTN